MLLMNEILAEYLDYSSSGKFCFSCMSEEFQLHWSFLEKIYYRPANFTDHCYSMPSNVYIGMSPCSHSMCVTVVEPRILAGQHIGNNVIRGCFTSVFRYGTTPRSQSSPVLDTSCVRTPAHRLLPPHMARRSSNRTVELCWCVGQLCNDYPAQPIANGVITATRSTISSTSSQLLLMMCTVIVILLVRI